MLTKSPPEGQRCGTCYFGRPSLGTRMFFCCLNPPNPFYAYKFPDIDSENGWCGHWSQTPLETGGPPPPSGTFKFNTIAGMDGSTFDVEAIAGANEVIVMLTGSGAASISTPSAAAIIAAVAMEVGSIYRFRLCNPSAGVITLVPGLGITITGIPTTAAYKWREYLVRCIDADTVDFRDVGSGNE